MATPAPGVAISFSQVNTVFVLTTPSPMNANYRFAPGTYTPATPAIPTTPAATFPMDVLHGRTKAVAPFITSYTHPNPAATSPYTTTWTSTVTGNIKVLTVGGGGGGASGANRAGGGGGGGGVCYNSAFPVVNGTVYNIAVGHGGVAGVWPGVPSPLQNGGNGGDSSFSTVVGKGGGYGSCNYSAGGPGGCGGGTGQDGKPPTLNAAGTATQPTSGSPGTNYGTAGKNSVGVPAYYAGGGGGAGATATTTPTGSTGGAGIANSITGAPVIYAGGGGGAYQTIGNVASTGKPGGTGGGGTASIGNAAGSPGTNNLGGGGGGGVSGPVVNPGGRGGNGIVIIAYP